VNECACSLFVCCSFVCACAVRNVEGLTTVFPCVILCLTNESHGKGLNGRQHCLLTNYLSLTLLTLAYCLSVTCCMMQLLAADHSYAQQCLKQYTAFVTGPPNRPTDNKHGFRDVVLAFLHRVAEGDANLSEFGHVHAA
jgi:hypothetical protein